MNYRKCRLRIIDILVAERQYFVYHFKVLIGLYRRGIELLNLLEIVYRLAEFVRAVKPLAALYVKRRIGGMFAYLFRKAFDGYFMVHNECVLI